MTTDGGFFDIHLRSLEHFANELETQLDALRRPADRLSGLAAEDLPLGRFGEADTLGAAHAAAARQMHGLLQAVRAAVGYAGGVTRTVINDYRAFDQRAADSYTTPAPGAGSAPPAGPVRPVSVTVSVAQPATITYSDATQAPQAAVGG